MLTAPFLTDLDSRARVKGSRDPLGIQPIWTRLGRYVVGNLTTVTTSVRDFTILLLGYHFAQRVSEDLGPGSELATFLKWEQLAAYARAVVNQDKSFRGTERVHKFLSEGSRVSLSVSSQHQIMSNQKMYGVWGLYSASARSSGLVDGEPARLTPPALDLVQRDYLAILGEEGFHDGKHIVALLRETQSRINARPTDRLIRAVARILRPTLRAREREFYRLHLLYGGPQDSTEGRQQQLATIVQRMCSSADFEWSPAEVATLAREARRQGDAWYSLAHRLDRIRTCETVLAPTSALFAHLLGQDGRPLDLVVKRVQEQWGNGVHSIRVDEVRELLPELDGALPGAGERWVAIADAAADGRYGDLLERLIAQNGAVMAARGGAPWLEKRKGSLHVRFRDEQGSLPAQRALPTLWRFPYFLDSLREIARTVGEED